MALGNSLINLSIASSVDGAAVGGAGFGTLVVGATTEVVGFCFCGSAVEVSSLEDVLFRSYSGMYSFDNSVRVIKIRVVFTLAPRALAIASSKRKSGLLKANMPG